MAAENKSLRGIVVASVNIFAGQEIERGCRSQDERVEPPCLTSDYRFVNKSV